jgi:hypothetical protein
MCRFRVSRGTLVHRPEPCPEVPFPSGRDDEGMDLWEFYDRVDRLILDLRGQGQFSEADVVETAIRGGATSGEILGRLSRALPDAAKVVPAVRGEVSELEAFVREALRPRT